jgi:tRNA pseudouridine38-40 synthase
MTLFDEAPQGMAEPEPFETVRVRMTVAYEGSSFHGFAANAGVRTVGGSLAEALAKVLGHAISLTCAGRTDKGVHAVGQVVSFDARSEGLDLEALQRSINALCGPAVAVRDAAVVAADFDARFSAIARRYRYIVWNRPGPDPFLAGRAWHVDVPLDLAAMTLACDPFIGEHDFSAFCRRPRPSDGREVSLVRRVVEAGWHDDGDGRLRFEIEAGAFCHQMVRSVVGTMVDVGRGRLRAGELVGILRSKNRNRAGDVAPPHGLYLLAVRYPGDP